MHSYWEEKEMNKLLDCQNAIGVFISRNNVSLLFFHLTFDLLYVYTSYESKKFLFFFSIFLKA